MEMGDRTGVGVLVIFGLFSFFLFKILTGSLYSVERHNVENTISQVNDRLRSAQVINYQTTNIFRPNFNKSLRSTNTGFLTIIC